MKNVIITGATGMVGSTLIDILLKDNVSVTAIIRPGSAKSGNIANDQKVQIVECRLSDLSKIENLPDSKYDAFFHFGWDGTYGDSRNDVYLQTENVKNTLDAVRLAQRFGCSVFVGSGSQAEYGKVSEMISESTPTNPISGYGIAKLSANILSKILCQKYNIRHCWGRIISCYGPRDNDYTMVISTITKMLKNQRLSFTKGDQVWDYLYSEDCARAFYDIAKNGHDGETYCIASGESALLKEFVEKMRNAVDISLPLYFGEVEYYKDQAMILACDISKIKQHTGFVPKTSFDEGIKKTVQWVIKR